VSRERLFPVRKSIHRILVVDGMELIRVALVKILSAVSNLIVCAATGDCDDVADLVERHRPHLVIVEPFQENRDGILWIKDLAGRFPQTKILVASSKAETTYAERALRAGASGYWMKTGSADSLREAISSVLSGQLYVSPRVGLLTLHKVLDRLPRNSGRLSCLSDRELAVFSFIAARHGTGQIARELGISRKTVETHCAHIKVKLGYSDAAALKRGAYESLA
jgi:DNA-binding NarL/FixJ family response regulator